MEVRKQPWMLILSSTMCWRHRRERKTVNHMSAGKNKFPDRNKWAKVISSEAVIPIQKGRRSGHDKNCMGTILSISHQEKGKLSRSSSLPKRLMRTNTYREEEKDAILSDIFTNLWYFLEHDSCQAYDT